MNFTTVGNRCLFLGKTLSGKSELIKWIVKKEMHLYDKVFAISLSEKVNKFYSSFIPKECVFSEFSEIWLKKLMEKMEIYKEQNPNKPKKILVIYDDVGAEQEFTSSNTFKQLMCRGRHINISAIFAQQFLTQCKPVCRNNCSFIITGQSNQNSQQILCDEFLAGNIDRKQFLEIYRNATKDYGFLIINNNSAKDSSNLDEIYGVLRTPNL